MDSATPYLEGIRVLDFTQYLSGPTCTRLLAELGAEIVKVEHPPYGDPTRPAEPRINRRSGYTVQQNRGKKSLCLDTTTPAGRQVVLDLVPHLDVVVENFAPGVMAKRGLAYEDLAPLNERLIMVSISGFGQTGPLRSKTAFDYIVQAFSGHMYRTGEPDGPPTMTGAAVVDGVAGVHAFAALGHALFRRERTSRGTYIDCAMLDAMFHLDENALWTHSMDPTIVPRRTGRNAEPAAPAGRFQGSQGYIVIYCLENQVRNLWAAMGRPELDHDERFNSNPRRNAHRDELNAMIDAWLQTFATDDDAVACLEAHRVPAARVLSPLEAAAHPHLVERGTVRTVHDRLAGDVTIPGFPLRFADAPPPLDLQVADLGQHNREVLGGLLGYDDERIAAMERDGVLASKDR
jgi:crotonobetainyl-CoA:carnitine CoA-transferase CaiB-like acyl-CoA transferase